MQLNSLDCPTLLLIHTLQCWESSQVASSNIFESLNSGLLNHLQTLYRLEKWPGYKSYKITIIKKYKNRVTLLSTFRIIIWILWLLSFDLIGYFLELAGMVPPRVAYGWRLWASRYNLQNPFYNKIFNFIWSKIERVWVSKLLFLWPADRWN